MIPPAKTSAEEERRRAIEALYGPQAIKNEAIRRGLTVEEAAERLNAAIAVRQRARELAMQLDPSRA